MSDDPPRLAEVYRTGEVYSRFPREQRVGGSLGATFIRVQQGDFEATDPATAEFCLGVSLGPQGGTHEVDFGEGRRHFVNPGTAIYLNPTADESHHRQSGLLDLMLVSAPMAELARRLEMEEAALWAALRPLHDVMSHDRRIRAQALGLWEHAARAGPFASLAVDHGLLTLAATLAERARPGEGRLPAPPPALDDARLARVVEYVEAHLAEPMTLDELAAVAALSPWHFNRAFRTAAGLPPHRYVVARRVERARALLAGPLPLAQIAFECGFASQSHFGQVFREHVGATPGAYRAELRG